MSPYIYSVNYYDIFWKKKRKIRPVFFFGSLPPGVQSVSRVTICVSLWEGEWGGRPVHFPKVKVLNGSCSAVDRSIARVVSCLRATWQVSLQSMHYWGDSCEVVYLDLSRHSSLSKRTDKRYIKQQILTCGMDSPSSRSSCHISWVVLILSYTLGSSY